MNTVAVLDGRIWGDGFINCLLLWGEMETPLERCLGTELNWCGVALETLWKSQPWRHVTITIQMRESVQFRKVLTVVRGPAGLEFRTYAGG